MSNAINLTLEVDDNGTVVMKKFSGNAEKELGRVEQKTASVSSRFKARLGSMGSSAAALAKKIGTITIAAGAMGAAFVLKGAISGFASFETALANMSKVTDESLTSIRAKILSLPPALGSATELTEGYYQVISAGVADPKKALDTLVVSAKAAKASHTEQGEVVKGLTSLMDAYGDSMGGAKGAADLLFQMEAKGKTQFSEMIPVIGGLSNMSAELGISQHELGGAFAQITKFSGGTSQAATQYRAVLQGLMSPTKKMDELLGQYGGSQKAIAELGFAGVMKKIAEETGGSSEALADLFGAQEATLGFLALSKDGFSGLETNIAAMTEATGASEKAWDNYVGTLDAMWETFKNTVGKQLVLLGEKYAPTIKKALADIGGWIEDNQDTIQAWGDAIAWVVGKVASLFEGVGATIGRVVAMATLGLEKIGVLDLSSGSAAETATVAETSSGGSAPEPSFATGTGLAGLPKTGRYIGHQSEIVLNKKESDAVRAGGGLGGDTYNITVAPQFMAGDRAAAREVAEVLYSEMTAMIHRKGGI